MIIECYYHVKGSDELTNKKHCHEKCYELIQPLSNDGNFVIKDNLYPIKYGSVYLINAIDIHCSVPLNANEYVRNKISLKSDIIDLVAEVVGCKHIISNLFKENNSAIINMRSKEIEHVDSVFASIYSMYKENEDNNKLEIISSILHLLQICFDNRDTSKEEHFDCVSEAINYINKNIAYDLTLTQISEALFLNKNYLSRRFKEKTSMTILEYIKERRISMAKKKLQFSDMSVSDIVQNCGFSNFSYFSKLFKSIEGITPTEYRNKYRD